MTSTIGAVTEFGRVKVNNFVRTEVANLRDPKVVEQIWKDARRAAAEESRPDWLNNLIHLMARK